MGAFWWAWLWQDRRVRRRKRRQEMAEMEARLRAELGLPPTAQAPPIAPNVATRPTRGRPRLRRWMVLTAALVVLLLLLAFLVYLVVFGVQHGYIYPAHHDG